MSKRLEKSQRLGPYTVIRFIGRGGMGEVYEAFEERLNRRVALKVISPRRGGQLDEKLVDRFMAEAKSLAQVHHQNVVSIFAIDEVDGRKFIAMEFIEGYPIDQLRKRFVFDNYDATHLLYQMLEGLKALHEKNIIHRDIKPGNIILQRDGRMKFIDFGLAKSLESKDETEATGEFCGTPRYLAPEVAAGAPSHTGSDIFCLGLVFYEMFSGERLVDPKGEMNPLTVIQSYDRFRFKSSAVSKRLMGSRLHKLLVGMLQPKPQNRYNTCEEVLKLIKPLVRESRKPGDQFFQKVCAKHTNLKSVYKHLINDLQYDPFSAKRILTITLGFPDFNLSAVDSDETADIGSSDGPLEFTFEKVKVENAQKKFEKFYDPQLMIEASGLKDPSAQAQIRLSSPQIDQSPQSRLGRRFLVGFVVVAATIGFSKTKWGKNFLETEIGRKIASLGRTQRSLDNLPLEAAPQGTLIWMTENGKLQTQFEWPQVYSASESAYLEVSSDMNFRRVLKKVPVSGFRTENFELDEPGHYFWRIRLKETPQYGPYQVWVDTKTAPKPLSPENSTNYKGSKSRVGGFNSKIINFYWQKKKVARNYVLQIATDTEFGTVVVERKINGKQTKKEEMPTGNYFWRLGTVTDDGTIWSDPYSFSVD